MTNRIAFTLALVVVAAGIADFVLTGGTGAIFLGRRFLGLLEWIAFWR